MKQKTRNKIFEDVPSNPFKNENNKMTLENRRGKLLKITKTWRNTLMNKMIPQA